MGLEHDGYPKHRLYTLVLLLGIVSILDVAQNCIPGRLGYLPTSGVAITQPFAEVLRFQDERLIEATPFYYDTSEIVTAPG
jgi:hypothetical protein